MRRALLGWRAPGSSSASSSSAGSQAATALLIAMPDARLILHSRQPCTGVVLEELGAAHVAAHGVEAAVAADLHELEHPGAGLGRAGQDPRVQQVAREVLGPEAGALGVVLDDVGHCPVRQRLLAYTASLAHAAQRRPHGDGCGLQPSPHRCDGTVHLAARDAMAWPAPS